MPPNRAAFFFRPQELASLCAIKASTIIFLSNSAMIVSVLNLIANR
jgi:hypothetical protein